MTLPSGATGPPAELVWRTRVHIGDDLRRLRQDRGLVWALAERDLRARYKQSYFGAAWALVVPFATVVVFTIFFKRIGRIDTGDVPYPLFTAVALVPWSFFTTSVSQAAYSLVAGSSILNKTYCAREVFPLAQVCVAAADALLATGALLVLFAWYREAPGLTVAWLPLLVALQLAVTVGVALALSVVVVYLRDVRQLVGAVLQAGLFLTPIAYPVDAIPAGLRSLAAAANPFVGILHGYRQVLLLDEAPDPALLLPAAATAVVVLVGGYLLFRRLEGGIADVA